MARMTMSFADWKEGKVAPAVVGIPVLDAKPVKEKAAPK
jgi:hypothetical protein